MFMTSLCSRYWQVLLAQGICVGLGSGLLGLTSAAVIPLYFSSRRMVATGIAATGSSLGMPSNTGSLPIHGHGLKRLQLESYILS